MLGPVVHPDSAPPDLGSGDSGRVLTRAPQPVLKQHSAPVSAVESSTPFASRSVDARNSAASYIIVAAPLPRNN
jgi:hypothetical protein